nr:TPA_asm: ND4 [Echinogammarus veneris]
MIWGVSMMLVTGVTGELIFSSLVVSGLFLMSGGDSESWKISLLGELDYISWSLVMLSFWVLMLCALSSSWAKKTVNGCLFFLLNYSLLLGFLVSFYVSDYMFFYFSFESCLIPIFFMILGWGYQPERVQAGVYMLFYTLFGSLPLFFMFMWLTYEGLGYMYNFSVPEINTFYYVFLLSAFLVKFPMYSVHLWLLKAHVEAPLAGSMVLAGVLLKLGGYGLIRILPYWELSLKLVSELIVCLSLWGGLVVSLSCLRQMDMKLLIASSSVVHMSACIGGVLVMSEWGVKGSLLMMVSHGLCSSGLFFLANVVYSRSGSRSMSVSKGFLSLMPSMSLVWFLIIVCNVGSPPSLNLLSEILLISALVNWNYLVMIVLGMTSFSVACYSIFLFSMSQHGQFLKSKSGVQCGSSLEYLVSLTHWLPMNLGIMCVYSLS